MLTCGSKSSPVLLLFTPTTQRLSGPSSDTYSDCAVQKCVQQSTVHERARSSVSAAAIGRVHTVCVTQSASVASGWRFETLRLCTSCNRCDSNEAQRRLEPELKCTMYHMLHSIHHCMTQCLCTGLLLTLNTSCTSSSIALSKPMSVSDTAMPWL
jgi:hypothetical protein